MTAQLAAATAVSFDDFLSAYDGVHAEWVDGEVLLMSPGNERQSKLTGFLHAILQSWAESHDLGEVYVPPFTVRTGEGTGRAPDVFFVRREHMDRVRRTHVDGAPDLVVEISGRESRGRDRGEKFYEYEAAGIPEYWLIDAERETVEAYTLQSTGRYAQVPLGDPPVLRSEVLPGIAIPVAWLWERPLPRLHRVLNEWGLT